MDSVIQGLNQVSDLVKGGNPLLQRVERVGCCGRSELCGQGLQLHHQTCIQRLQQRRLRLLLLHLQALNQLLQLHTHIHTPVRHTAVQRTQRFQWMRSLTCWPWGLCKIWATAATVSVLEIWDAQSGRLCTMLAGVAGVAGVPLRRRKKLCISYKWT